MLITDLILRQIVKVDNPAYKGLARITRISEDNIGVVTLDENEANISVAFTDIDVSEPTADDLEDLLFRYDVNNLRLNYADVDVLDVEFKLEDHTITPLKQNNAETLYIKDTQNDPKFVGIYENLYSILHIEKLLLQMQIIEPENQ